VETTARKSATEVPRQPRRMVMSTGTLVRNQTLTRRSSYFEKPMGEPIVVPRSGRSRKAVLLLTALSVVGMLALIWMVWLSGFPGTPKDVRPKTEAPPEDVRRR
jgi:hypothetical protein